jgi:hypothetical protein
MYSPPRRTNPQSSVSSLALHPSSVSAMHISTFLPTFSTCPTFYCLAKGRDVGEKKKPYLCVVYLECIPLRVALISSRHSPLSPSIRPPSRRCVSRHSCPTFSTFPTSYCMAEGRDVGAKKTPICENLIWNVFPPRRTIPSCPSVYKTVPFLHNKIFSS